MKLHSSITKSNHDFSEFWLIVWPIPESGKKAAAVPETLSNYPKSSPPGAAPGSSGGETSARLLHKQHEHNTPHFLSVKSCGHATESPALLNYVEADYGCFTLHPDFTYMQQPHKGTKQMFCSSPHLLYCVTQWQNKQVSSLFHVMSRN